MKMNQFRMKLHAPAGKDKIVLLNVAGAFTIKGFALLISLFTMPAYMSFFADQQVLGVWFTILSVLTWILNFDLGIGNGLRNKLTEALTKGDQQAAREYIASSYWLIGALVAVLIVLGWCGIPQINWNHIYNISPSLIPADVLRQVTRYIFLGIMLQFFLRLINSVMYAMQWAAVNNLIVLSTSVLQLLVALTAPSSTPAENLKMFSVSYIFTANIPLLIANLCIFLRPLRACAPLPGYIRKHRVNAVMSLGGIFFVCQILYMVIANTNEFFISQYTSPENVVTYQIYNRLFGLGSTFFMLALTPIWSAVSKAIAEKDYRWLQKLNKQLILLSIAASAAEFLLIPFLQWIINIWLNEEAIQVNYLHAFCFSFFGSTMVFQSAVSTIANGAGRMKIQALCYGVGIALKFLLIHIGTVQTGSWIIVVLANAIILVPYCIIQEIDICRFIRKNISQNDAVHNSAVDKIIHN